MAPLSSPWTICLTFSCSPLLALPLVVITEEPQWGCHLVMNPEGARYWFKVPLPSAHRGDCRNDDLRCGGLLGFRAQMAPFFFFFFSPHSKRYRVNLRLRRLDDEGESVHSPRQIGVPSLSSFGSFWSVNSSDELFLENEKIKLQYSAPVRRKMKTGRVINTLQIIYKIFRYVVKMHDLFAVTETEQDFCSGPVVLTLVPPAAPCLRSLHVSRVWKGSEQREAAAAVSAHVTWLFSSLHAAIIAGQGVKGTTVAKHAGIHGLWVALPPALAALVESDGTCC